MNPTWLMSTVQAGGGAVMVWGMFSQPVVDPLISLKHCMTATAMLATASMIMCRNSGTLIHLSLRLI